MKLTSIRRLLAVVILLVSGARPLWAGHAVGIEFVSAPVYSPLISFFVLDNFFPYMFTGASSPFASEGALAGVSEVQFQQAVVDAVQRSFRRAEIDMPGRMLNVDIRLGALTPQEGTTHLIGGSFSPTTLFGSAYPTGAIFRPDLQPGSIYSNALSLTFADSIGTIPQLDPTARFQTRENAVEAIAGTTAHEIAHTLNVWNHDPATQVGGYYPIMATGSTGLPLSARLQERRFLDIPNTQYQFPQPPPSGPLIYSTTDTLLRASGTTWVSDFNFDGQLNVTDQELWSQHRFQESTGVKRGDANDDLRTDVLDLAILRAQERGFAYEPSTAPQPLLTYDAQTGMMTLDSSGLGVETLYLAGAAPQLLEAPYVGIPGLDWETANFAGAQHWHGIQPMVTNPSLLLGTWAVGLSSTDFGTVELGTVDQGRVQTSVRVVPEPSATPVLFALAFLRFTARRRRPRLDETAHG